MDLEKKCKYEYVCQFGKESPENPEDCIFYKIYQETEIGLMVKQDMGVISDKEIEYLRTLSGLD